MHDSTQTTDWVSITEAASRLTANGDRVDRSTLSRYVKQHAEALETKLEGRSTLVSFSALAAHRSENIRIRADERSFASDAPKMRGRSSFQGSQSDGAARKAQADAELRELDLAERRGEVTPTDEVDDAARTSVVLMQAAFERSVETEAASLALKYGWDERTVRIALKSFARIGLDVFHDETMKRLDHLRRKREAGGIRLWSPGESAELQ